MRSSNRKMVLLMGALMMVAPAAWGQSEHNVKQVSVPLDVAVTFNASVDNNVPGSSFWMQGGSAQVHGQFWRGLGVVADVAGLHTANIHSSGVGLDLVTVTFGPRYTWGPAHHGYTFFGQFLAGEASGLNGVFPYATGTDNTANGLGLQVGGGMSVPVAHHFAVRAFDADWLRTQLPNATTNVQNNFRLGAGLIFRFK
jgi:hypothetical protein